MLCLNYKLFKEQDTKYDFSPHELTTLQHNYFMDAPYFFRKNLEKTLHKDRGFKVPSSTASSKTSLNW